MSTSMSSESEDAAVASLPPRPRRMILSENDDIDSDNDLHDESSSQSSQRVRPPRPSTAPRASLLVAAQRRRSSTRLLQGGGRRSSIGSTSSDNTPNLSELYKKAIRMNAENRINSQNSWNLNLIEHMDKVLKEEHSSSSSTTTALTQDSHGVNFTKASCTIDASVKIYSYRVDDVHLTSYKVLANLNRNDNATAAATTEATDDSQEGGMAPTSTRKAASKSNNHGPTIEANIANLNLNKLDSAFDIDPLFHKMSKAFDEGGAKGLLLVNLSLGSHCNIVFDSTETTAAAAAPPQTNSSSTASNTNNTLDLSMWTEKYLGDSVESLPLVPQLASLRAQYEELEAQGFVMASTTGNKTSRRYAPQEDEEEEADHSIHQEALERSTRSRMVEHDDDMPLTINNNKNEEDDEDDFAPPDFGGADDDDDDFVAFVANDEEGGRFSTLSFDNNTGSPTDVYNEDGTPESNPTTLLLDALSSSNTLWSQSDYSYVDTQALLSQDNSWAGAAQHWTSQRRRTAAGAAAAATSDITTTRKKTTKPKKTRSKKAGLVSWNQNVDTSDLWTKPPKPKKSSKDPLQWSQSVIAKHSSNNNLLPFDTNINVETLSKLFLRPHSTLKQQPNATNKSVGFDMTVETWMGGNNEYDDHDDNNDGPGFVMNDDDDDHNNDDMMIVPELEGIRKVEKVHVNYATVAKKVDVRRLKHDLWLELAAKFGNNKDSDDDDDDDDDDEPEVEGVPTSFQDVVHDLECAKSQADVTLPFYFICILHLANEKGLELESQGLENFLIRQDTGVTQPSY